jgi:hypothetical protein
MNFHLVMVTSVMCAMALFAAPAQAQLLDYGTYNGFGLGKGILGNDFEHPLPQCVNGQQGVLPASHADVRASIVYNESEYQRAFHIDQNAKASFLGIGGGGEEFHFRREQSGSSTAFAIILEAYSEADGDTLNNVQLMPPYQAMMNSGDPAKIAAVRKICGDRFIETVFRESRLFVVLKVSAQQQSTLTAFSGRGNGSIDVGIASASASLGGDATIQSANKSGAITPEIHSEGIGGLVPTANAIGIASADGLSAIANKLLAYLGTLHVNGQPVKYQLASIPGMPINDLMNERVFGYLGDMKADYAEAKSRSENLSDLVQPGDQRRAVLQLPQADATVNLQQAVLSAYLNSISAAHDACRKASELSKCIAARNSVGHPPARTDVELAPIMPAYFVPPSALYADEIPTPRNAPVMPSAVYGVWLDGRLIAPAQANLLFSRHANTLLDAAKQLDPAVANVDVMALISSPYVATLTLLVFPDTQHPGPPKHVDVTASQLAWPSYIPSDKWNSRFTPLPLVHADVQHPCLLIQQPLAYDLSSACLTSGGMALFNSVLANVAAAATIPPHPGRVGWFGPAPLIANVQDCFSAAQAEVVASEQQSISAGPMIQANARLVTFLEPAIAPGQPIFLQSFGVSDSENHDKTTWGTLASQLRATLTNPIPGGLNVCSPHIQ